MKSKKKPQKLSLQQSPTMPNQNTEGWKEDVKHFIGDGLDFLDIEPIIENAILQAKQEERESVLKQIYDTISSPEMRTNMKDSKRLEGYTVGCNATTDIFIKYILSLREQGT